LIEPDVVRAEAGGEAVPNEDIPRYMNLMRVGRISLSQLITGIYSLDDVNLAIDEIRSGRAAGRCLIQATA